MMTRSKLYLLRCRFWPNFKITQTLKNVSRLKISRYRDSNTEYTFSFQNEQIFVCGDSTVDTTSLTENSLFDTKQLLAYEVSIVYLQNDV